MESIQCIIYSVYTYTVQWTESINTIKDRPVGLCTR